jgi:hypothetical protein
LQVSSIAAAAVAAATDKKKKKTSNTAKFSPVRLSDSQHVMPTHTRSSITKRVSNHILNNIFPFCRVSKSFGLSLNFCKIVPDLTTMLSKAIVRAASDKGNFL